MSEEISKILHYSQQTILLQKQNLLNKKKSFFKRRAWSIAGGLEQVSSIYSLECVYHLLTIFLVVFSDYFSSILGLVRDGLNWSLEPFEVSLTILIWVNSIN